MVSAASPARSRATDQRSIGVRLRAPLALAVGAPLAGIVVLLLVVVADAPVAAGVAVVLVAGVAGALGAFLLLHRLRVDVEEPVIELREAVVRLGVGEPADAVLRSHGGPLSAVAAALESAAASVDSRTGQLVSRAEWGESSRQILDALDFTDDEPAAFEVVSRALALADDQLPSELLFSPAEAPNVLEQVAANSATGSPGCPVQDPANCLAIRRGQVVVAESSEAIDACPQLRGRPGGPCSSACVPVAVEGRSIGVLHVTGAERNPPTPTVVARVSELSRQVGGRLSALRALESSRQEAGTDGLTGLPNRRILESQMKSMLDAGTGFVSVMADLDKFKSLNDTFGHEAGDRALQLFARVMQDNVRGHDVVARVGGEEFVVVYPEMSVQRSIEAIERLRTALASEVAVAAARPFTCSFGVTHSSVGTTVAEILRVADAGLLRAKELGGDQVVYADQALAQEVFDPSDPDPPNRGR